MEQRALDHAVDTAKIRWHRNKRPDTFRTKVATKNGDQTEHVNVHIYHHETFPLGGQTFTVDVRTLPDHHEQPGNLLHRDRLNLAATQV